MANRLDNLGDYNIVRDDLYAHDGNAESLYKDIGDTAVAEARPEIMKDGITIGFIIGFAIPLAVGVVRKGIAYFNQRKKDKKLIDSKEELKQRYDQVVIDVDSNCATVSAE